jgi:hypothetical protein
MYSVEVSLDDLSLPSVSFSSEGSVVLNFFASFFGSSQKMKWGLGQSTNSEALNLFKLFLMRQL